MPNLSNIEKAMKQGALGKAHRKTTKHQTAKKTTKEETNSQTKPKSNHSEIFHAKLIHNDGKSSHLSLKDYNQQLRPAKRLQSRFDLHNEFKTYPILPDLLTYCQMDAKHQQLPQPNSKVATLQLLTHSNGTTLGAERSLGLLNNTKSVHLQMPTYLSNALKYLTKLVKNIQRTDYGYSSLSHLRKLIMANINDFRFNINKSSIIMLLLMGLLKPDAKLKKALLKSATNNQATSNLIQIGYLTPSSAKKMSYTTISVPLDISLWLNLAEINIMKDFTKNDINFAKVANSCKYLRSIDGGVAFKLNNYLSSFTNLINFKLQKDIL